MKEWICPHFNPDSADFPGPYVAARGYEAMLRDIRAYAERLEKERDVAVLGFNRLLRGEA